MVKVLVVNPEKRTGNVEFIPDELDELENHLNDGYSILDKTVVPAYCSVANSNIGGYKSLGSVIYILEKK